MKFICTVDIQAPIDKVIRLYDNPSNLNQWQDGFLGIEYLDNKPGEPYSKALMKYQIGRRSIEITETILTKNLPIEMSCLYEYKEGSNTMLTTFHYLGNDSTRYMAEVEYLEFNSFMMKCMSKLTPSVFKKQTQKWLDQFKAFVERS